MALSARAWVDAVALAGATDLPVLEECCEAERLSCAFGDAHDLQTNPDGVVHVCCLGRNFAVVVICGVSFYFQVHICHVLPESNFELFARRKSVPLCRA